jgi:hypothetical protein
MAFVPDEHAAHFGHQTEYFCLKFANDKDQGFTQQLFLVLRKSAENPTAFERVGVSEYEDFAAYREKAGHLFEDAELMTIKVM